VKFGEGDVHKNLPNDCEFRENRRSKGRTLLNIVNGLLLVLSIFTVRSVKLGTKHLYIIFWTSVDFAKIAAGKAILVLLMRVPWNRITFWKYRTPWLTAYYATICNTVLLKWRSRTISAPYTLWIALTLSYFPGILEQWNRNEPVPPLLFNFWRVTSKWRSVNEGCVSVTDQKPICTPHKSLGGCSSEVGYMALGGTGGGNCVHGYGAVSFRFSRQNPVRISPLPYTCHMSRPSHPLSFDHLSTNHEAPNYAVSCYFLHLRAKHLPQHRILEYLQPVLLP
jgi:hypothetical protein